MSRSPDFISGVVKKILPVAKKFSHDVAIDLPAAVERGHAAIVPVRKGVATSGDNFFLYARSLVYCRSCCLSVNSDVGDRLGHVVFHAAGNSTEKSDIINFSRDFWKNSGVRGDVSYELEAVHAGPFPYRNSEVEDSCDDDMMEIMSCFKVDPMNYIAKKEEGEEVRDALSKEVFELPKHYYHKVVSGLGFDRRSALFAFDAKSGEFVTSFSLASDACDEFLKNDSETSKLELPKTLVYTSFASTHPSAEMVEGATYCDPEHHKSEIAKAAAEGKVVRVVQDFPKLFSLNSSVFLREKPKMLIGDVVERSALK